MKKTILSFKRVLISIMCVSVLISTLMLGAVSASAANTFSMSSSAVSGNTFSVKLFFPNVTWGGFELVVSYDTSVIQLTADPTISTSPMIYAAPSSVGNSTGSLTIAGGGVSDITTTGIYITLPFTVVNSSAENTTISLSITKFVLANQTNISASAPSPLTVTLRQGSTSTDTSSGSSSGGQSSGSQSSGSQSSGTTNTGSGSAGTSDTPSVNSSSSKPTSSAKPSSNPVSSNPETSDTGTETDTQITDTESGFEISQTETDAGTGTEGAPPVTDTNDAPSGTTTGISASADTSTQKPKGGLDLSTSAIAIISLSVAAFICCLLTLAGFLRHKKD